jgi:hypothetical protein
MLPSLWLPFVTSQVELIATRVPIVPVSTWEWSPLSINAFYLSHFPSWLLSVQIMETESYSFKILPCTQ